MSPVDPQRSPRGRRSRLLAAAIAGALGTLSACSATAPGGDLLGTRTLEDAATPPGSGATSPIDATVEDAIVKDATLEGAAPGPSADASAEAADDGSGPALQDAAPPADSDTCGPCSGTCFGARCLVVLASGQVNPGSIAVTPNAVYWTNAGRPDTQYAEAAVLSVGLDGGAPTTLASTPGGTQHVVVADSTGVFWATSGSIAAELAVPGATPRTIAAGVNPTGLALDDAGVYWTSDVAPYPTSAVWRANRDGSGPAQLMEGSGTAHGILAWNGAVFWQAYETNYTTEFFSVWVDGGSPAMLASGLASGVFPWAVHSSGIYWATNFDPVQILRLALDGGTPSVVATEFTASGMTADESQVYFTSANAVYAMPVDGGAPAALTWRLPSPYQIAIDDSSLYWTDIGACDAGACSGAVLKLTPK